MVRPLDAYGALMWLRSQPLVGEKPIGLHGWSNGAMAALWAMSPKLRLKRKESFAAAVVFYPGCASLLQSEFEYDTYAPVLMLLAEHDNEVNPKNGQKLAKNADSKLIAEHTYPGAGHNFDDPDKQDHANSDARKTSLGMASSFFSQYFA